MGLQITLLSIHLGYYGWYIIDILDIELLLFDGSLLYIGKSQGRWRFDILFMRQLFFWIKDKLNE